ncbi:MAG TPA: hypothetical protein VF043_04330 [Ktedonobacteraceae bacterium]
MSLSQAHNQTSQRTVLRNQVETRLYGRRLLVARAVWIVLVIFTLGLFFISFATYAPRPGRSNALLQSYLLHPDTSVNGYIAFGAHLGALVGEYNTANIILIGLASLSWIVVGCVIFWRKSDDWMALLVALALVLFGVAFSPPLATLYVLAGTHSVWRLLITSISVIAYGCMGLFFCLFPNGRFVPRWACWLALVNLVYQVPFIVPLNSPLSFEQWPPLFFAVLEVSFVVMLLFVQLYRYRCFSNSIQRKQTRWVVFGMVITLIGYAALFAPPLFAPLLAQPGLPKQIFTLISQALLPLVLLMLPLTVGIAMLRYRLWDIDVLINRTLVYGTLTVVLVLVYFSGVVLLQQLFQSITGQGSALAITGSTLGIVVLFQPLRSGLQTIIDRRFYRRKYDAARVLAAFSARLQRQDDVDLKTLSDDLLTVIQATMEPTHVSLWLCQPASKNKADEDTLSQNTSVITRLLKDSIREETN